MPRQGGLYKKDSDGKSQLIRATSPIKRDRNNRVVNPDGNNQAIGRDAALKASDRPAQRPEPEAAAANGAESQARKSSKQK